MKRLIILSDMWGAAKSEWPGHYIGRLKGQFEIAYYDSRTLADIEGNIQDGEALHDLFVNGGADRAVNQLLKLEKKADAILGSSIGGWIAWKACLAGLNVQDLVAVSATRLRHETRRPSARISLFYGSSDPFIPREAWFADMGVEPALFNGEGHRMYEQDAIAADICGRIMGIHHR